ncbi:hypothetical protein B0H13DRAFT_2434921 [Mycena leptocephala]|nr:hypothetical protein B0H13DRAFT_2434921 [Mycena leptocephala]
MPARPPPRRMRHPVPSRTAGHAGPDPDRAPYGHPTRRRPPPIPDFFPFVFHLPPDTARRRRRNAPPALLSSQPATSRRARAPHLKTSRPLQGDSPYRLRGCGAICPFGGSRWCCCPGEKEGEGGRLEGKGGTAGLDRGEAVEKRVSCGVLFPLYGVLRFEYPPPSAFGFAFPVFSPFLTHLRPFLELTRSPARFRPDTHGIAALAIRDGRAHKPEHQATYSDGDWEGTVNKVCFGVCVVFSFLTFGFSLRLVLFPAPCRPYSLAPCTLLELAPTSLSRPCLSLGCSALFVCILSDSASPTLTSTSASTISFSPRPPTPFASALPPMTVLINGRDEPRVVFDVGPLVEDLPTLAQALTLSDPTPFALSPRARALLISASSAELTTDLVPVLSMTKLADASVSGGAGGFYYRNSWWAGKFEDLNNVKWEDKKDVLYWRGKSNGGHIRGTNYRSFPRFRLMDLAALPENLAKGLFDVRITQWHEWHCTDDCDADTIRNAYNITGESVPREEAYQYKYLLDVNGNTFSGR